MVMIADNFADQMCRIEKEAASPAGDVISSCGLNRGLLGGAFSAADPAERTAFRSDSRRRGLVPGENPWVLAADEDEDEWEDDDDDEDDEFFEDDEDEDDEFFPDDDDFEDDEFEDDEDEA